MLNKKPLLGLAAMSLLVTSPIYAQTKQSDDPEATVSFSGKIEPECGISAEVPSAELAFGEAYNASEAKIKIVSNSNHHVHFYASEVDLGELDDQVETSEVHFKTTGPLIDDKPADKWLGHQNKERITRDQLKQNNIVAMNARVQVEEGELDASDSDYVVAATWTLECH